MSKNPVLITFIVWTLLLSSSAQVQSAKPAATQPSVTASAPIGPTLEDGTPVKLRMEQTVSSADAHVGDSVALEVLEEVRVGNTVIVPKGGIAMATVTTAQSKRNMGRGGKLVHEGERHYDSKGTEVAAFVSGDMPLDMAKFQAPAGVAPATSAASGATELNLSSKPAEAEISIDGNFVGNTPSSVNVATGDHTISIRIAGYQSWDRTIHTSAGKVNLTARLVKSEVGETVSSTTAPTDSLADAARVAKAKHAAVQTPQSAGPQN